MARQPLSLLLTIGLGASLLAAPAARPLQSDLDTFMKQVLARRDENWKKLQEFILDERELVQLRGVGGIPIWGQQREYSWFIQDGRFVRSPTKANGVDIGDAERRRAEAEYVRRAEAREKRDAEREAGRAADRAKDPEAGAAAADPNAGIAGLIDEAGQPEFVNSAYFLKFKFEEGKYAFVGRESFEGLDVLKIEYYPTKLFAHEQDQERKRRADGRRDRDEDAEAALERMMNKVSLVTLWVEPASHQIVKYTFDNVNLDFLPAAWLVRIDSLTASMTMSQPFPDVWLPRDLQFRFGATFAVGPFDMRYQIAYYDYREAKTSGRIRKEGGRP